MLYILLLLVFGVSMWASYRVKSVYRSCSKFSSRYSGYEAARLILDSVGLRSVRVEKLGGFLTDHYDTSLNVLRLSAGVYEGRNLSSLGIAAHEAGHALQKADGYSFLLMRQALVPVAKFSSLAFNVLIFVGIFASLFFHTYGLLKLALLFLLVTVIFSLLTLPVEFDASERAKGLLVDLGIITVSEREHVARVLSSAALTYVASSAGALMMFIYMLLGLGSGD